MAGHNSVDIFQAYQELEDEGIVLICHWLIEEFLLAERNPRMNSAFSGAAFKEEMMMRENELRFRSLFRMSRATFVRLCAILQHQGGLVASMKISIEEKIMIFIFIITGHSYTSTSVRFQHSRSKISAILHDVCESFERACDQFIIRPSGFEPVPSLIINDPKKYPYFKDCIGAVDGTHIPCVPPNDERERFFDRFQGYSQNVLGICSFDMTFSYVLAGFEGSVHDHSILTNAFESGFTIPNGKYILGDSGFALSKQVLTPYRKTRYHIDQYKQGGPPKDHKEYFNLQHSSLRTCIERCFGVMKKKFSILKNMNSFPFPIQVSLVKSCFYLHNFIRRSNLENGLHEEEDYNNVEIIEEEKNEMEEVVDESVSAWRDRMALDMWNAYQHHLATHK